MQIISYYTLHLNNFDINKATFNFNKLNKSHKYSGKNNFHK